jgi:hypothetical protein
MQEKTKTKQIIKNGKSPAALKSLVNQLISDVTWKPVIEQVDGCVRICEERFEIFWRSKTGAEKSLKKAKAIVDNIEENLADANLVANKEGGKIQGQLVLEVIDDVEGEDLQCRLIGWFQNRKKNWVPKILVSKSFSGEKKIYFGKGFSFTVFVK